MGRSHLITDWNPQDAAAREGGNKDIARRNLLCTVAGDHVALSVWTLCPVMRYVRRPAPAAAAPKSLLTAEGARV
jgi:hypothetical protein